MNRWLELMGPSLPKISRLGAPILLLACSRSVVLSQAPEEEGPSRCDFAGRSDVEVSEVTANGASRANVRRVYRVEGELESHKRVLNCREVDTNFDGIKDLVRFYDSQGKPKAEHADSDYDGKVDTWVEFAGPEVAAVKVDHDADGVPDEFRRYRRGELRGIERDTNHDGRPDTWEIYAGGRLVRLGVDADHDGRVDRWGRSVEGAAPPSGVEAAASSAGASH